MKENKKTTIKSAFSLIELIIVIAIILIMTAVLFVSNNGRKAQGDVDSVTRQIAAQIRALQNESLNGKKIGSEYANHYIFNATTTAYTVRYKNSSNVDIAGSSQTVDLSKNRVSITDSSGATPVGFSFTSPLGTVSSAKTIKVTSSTTPSVFMYICVSNSGSVNEQKTFPCI